MSRSGLEAVRTVCDHEGIPAIARKQNPSSALVALIVLMLSVLVNPAWADVAGRIAGW